MDSDLKREYSRRWYLANKERVKAYAQSRKDEKNRLRRERYAADHDFREETKRKVRESNSKRKSAKKNYALGSSYGITFDEYEDMMISQHGRCAICGVCHEDEKKQFCVDHDHESGVIRGLLCHRCNFAIGLLREDPVVAENASRYLSYHASVAGKIYRTDDDYESLFDRWRVSADAANSI